MLLSYRIWAGSSALGRLIGAALGILGCTGLADAQSDKASAPIPAATLSLITAKGASAASPILFRAYKKESEIELWKRNGAGRFVLVKSYPICRWSGQLGPKTKNGDRQTPEGFYTVEKTQMNPNSKYFLSFDIGYPNAFDKAHGFTGSAVMVHGICSSMGCFAMTDAVAGELFAIAREAFAGGQSAFQFQSFPFRMSASNMARYRTDPNIAFWRQLKEGSDRFEATGQEPVVSVTAAKRYAFAPLKDSVLEAVAQERRKSEDAQIAKLVDDGSAAVRTTYSDGGQHSFWASLIQRGFPVGDVSRPETLAYAGQEVVVIPARRKPSPVPEAVWAAWIAPGTVFHPQHSRGFVPVYEVEPSRFAPLVARYDASLPTLLRQSMSSTDFALVTPDMQRQNLLAQN